MEKQFKDELAKLKSEMINHKDDFAEHIKKMRDDTDKAVELRLNAEKEMKRQINRQISNPIMDYQQVQMPAHQELPTTENRIAILPQSTGQPAQGQFQQIHHQAMMEGKNIGEDQKTGNPFGSRGTPGGGMDLNMSRSMVADSVFINA